MADPYAELAAQGQGSQPQDLYAGLRPSTQPGAANGAWDDVAAGFQSSATGLALRGKLPSVQLDSSHAKWYDRAIAGATGVVSDLPEMAVGFVGGAAAGTAVAPGPGTAIGAGAGAFAVPTAIRESLIQAYTKGDVTSAADFLQRTSIVLGQTAKAAAIGGLTAGVGEFAAKGAGTALVGTDLSAGASRGIIGASRAAGEVGTMTVAPAALDGRLPNPQDFVDAAVMVAGLKGAGLVAGRLGQLYAKAGVTPEEAAIDANNNPDIKEELASGNGNITDLPEAYDPLIASENAKQAIPDPSASDVQRAQAFVDKPFGDIPQQPGEPKVDLYPNFKYINTTDDVKAVLARATELYGDDIVRQTRGVVPWAQTETEAAGRLAEMVGAKDTSLLADRQPGTGAGATEMYLRSQLMQKAVEDFTSKAQGYDPLKSSPEDAIEMQAAAERVAMLSANFQGAASETGRALNALKMMNAGLRQADAIQKLMDGSPDAGQIAEIMRQVDNPVAAAQAARAVLAPKPLNTMQKIGQVYRSILLSGFKTYQVKALGDAVALASNVVDRMVATGIGLLHPGESVTARETMGYMTGMVAGSKDALKIAAAGWRKAGQPGDADNAFGYRPIFGEDEPGVHPEPMSAADIGNRILAIPHRIMGAETEFARTLNMSGEATALAIRQAISEKFTPGTDDFNNRVQAIKSNPDGDMQAAIEKAGDDGTFTGKLGATGKIVQAISQHPIGQFVVPFATVPSNLVTWAVKRIPGAAFMLDDVKADFAAGGAQRDIAIARQMVGATVMSLALGAVKGGNLTGGGIYLTPEQKQAKIDAGWQPYSLKIGDKWYSYARFDPMARVAALAADIGEIHEHLDDDDKASLPAMAGALFGNALVSQTYLSGLNSFLKALDEPAQNAKQWFDGMVGSWVPAFLAQTASQMDPYARRVDNAIDAIQSKLPILRNKLLPKINTLTGEPLQNTGDVTPVAVSQISNDPVLQEAARLEVGAAKAPKSIELPSMKQRDIGKVNLTPEQQNLYSTTSGQLAHRALSGIVGSPQWEGMPDMVKKEVFSQALKEANKVAHAEVLTPEQREQESQRISDDLAVRLRGK